jgi:hypothetical protein
MESSTSTIIQINNNSKIMNPKIAPYFSIPKVSLNEKLVCDRSTIESIRVKNNSILLVIQTNGNNKKLRLLSIYLVIPDFISQIF